MGLFKKSIPVWKAKFIPPAEVMKLVDLFAEQRDAFVDSLEATKPDLTIVHGDFRLVSCAYTYLMHFYWK